MDSRRQSLGGDRHRRVQPVTEVRHHVEVCSPSLPQRDVAGAGVLTVNGCRIEVRLRLSEREHILITGPASAVSLLHEQPIFLILVERQHADGVSQVAVEGVLAVTEVIELADAILFLIEGDDDRIGSAADPFAVNIDRVAAVLRHADFKPIGVARLIESAADDRRQSDRLRRLERVVRFRFDRDRLFRDEDALSIQRAPTPGISGRH